MTQIDQIIADALAGSPETHVTILAREVVRLREAPVVVVREHDGSVAGLVNIRSWIGAVGPVGGMVWVDPWEAIKVAGVRAIPADRVLGEGMVGVDRKKIEIAAFFLEEYASRVPGISAVIAALRANQGVANHD